MLKRLSNIIVVLVRPRFPENIGSAARAVANLGLGGLTVVEPERPWEEPMQRLASTCGRAVLDDMRTCDTLEEALADCVAAAGTTARRGRERLELLPPRKAAPRLLDWAAQGKVGLIFGPEDKGLTTRELDHCFLSICIPTSDESSLNLAQAVVVLGYELRASALAAWEDEHPPAPPGRDHRPASHGELTLLKDRLTEGLTAIGVLPEDNPDHFFRPFKSVLERARLTSREVRAWHGIARQALWAAGEAKKRQN